MTIPVPKKDVLEGLPSCPGGRVPSESDPLPPHPLCTAGGRGVDGEDKGGPD